MPHRQVRTEHRNTLYLLAAVSMISMTLVVAVQPLFLRGVLGLERDNAGFVNANIQVITELVDLLFVGYLGYLSDRFGRVPLIVFGLMLSGAGALLAPYSLQLGLLVGLSGITFFYLMRVVISLGSAAVLPQIATLSGDFSDREGRPRLVANAGFMMAFGATLVYAIFMQIPREMGVESILFLTAVVAFIGAWLAKRYLVDVAPRLNEWTGILADSSEIPPEAPHRRLLELVRNERGLTLSFLAAFITRNDMVVVGLFLMTWAIYFAELLGVDHAQAAGQAGLVIGFVGIVVLVSIPIWGWIIARIGRVAAIVLGAFLSGVGFCAVGLVVNPLNGTILLPALLVGFGQAGSLLAPQILTLDLAPDEMRGTVSGMFNTVGCLGVVFFLLAGGILFDWLGPTAPFVLVGLANLAVMGFGLWLLKPKTSNSCAIESTLP